MSIANTVDRIQLCFYDIYYMPTELFSTFANFGLSALLLLGVSWVFYKAFIIPSTALATEDRAESKKRIESLETRVRELGEKLEQQNKDERVTLINMSNRLVKVVEENNRVIENNTYVLKSIYTKNVELYEKIKELQSKHLSL